MIVFRKLIGQKDRLLPGGSGKPPLAAVGAAYAAAALVVSGCSSEAEDSAALQDVLKIEVFDKLSLEKACQISLQGTWDTVVNNDSKVNGLLVKINNAAGQPVYFFRESIKILAEFTDADSAARKIAQDVVSEGSAYWLRNAAGLVYAGVSAEASREFFIRTKRGIDMLTELPGCSGVFPAWAARIVSGEITLNPDKPGPQNSASDADHDYVMALLAARANLENKIWHEDTELNIQLIDAWLAELLPALYDEYIEPGKANGLYVLKPSEDYGEDITQTNYRLDYLSPETCFAIEKYLRDTDPKTADKWRTIGENSMEIYLTCLTQPGLGVVPAEATLSWEAGKLKIDPNGTWQTWDGIRAPSRIAAALPYLGEEWLNAHRAVLTAYLQRWNDGYTVKELDASAYLSLAVHLGENEIARTIAQTLGGGFSAKGVYAETHKYFETSLITKNLLELFYPYGLKARIEPQITHNSAELDKVKQGSFVVDEAERFYRKFGDTGYVYNNDPVPVDMGNGYMISLKEFVPAGYDLINSESLVYGLMDALADFVRNDQDMKAADRIKSLINTIYLLCQENHQETNTTLRLLPWAAMSNGLDFQIIQRPNVQNYGNASASDADLLLIATLIKIKEIIKVKENSARIGLDKNILDYFIHRYTDNFVERVLKTYRGADKKLHFIMTAGGLVTVDKDPLTGEPLYRINTSYINYGAMQVIKQYFAQESRNGIWTATGLGQGSLADYSSYAEVFAQLENDTRALMALLTSDENFPLSLGKDFPEVVYVRASAANGLEVLKEDSAEKDERYKPYQPQKDNVAGWRLALNGLVPTDSVWGESFNSAYDGQRYYHYYLKNLIDKLDFSGGAAGKLDFTTTSARYSLNDTIYNNGWLAGIQHHIVSNIIPLGQFSLRRDEMFPSVNYKPPFAYRENAALQNWYSSTSPEKLYKLGLTGLRDGMKYAIDLKSDTAHIYKGFEVYRTMILAGLEMLPDNADAVSYIGQQIYMVDNYLEALINRGWDDDRIIQEINVLLAIADQKEASLQHPIVKALWGHKLLRYASLPPYERELLKTAAVEYGWAELIDAKTGQPPTEAARPEDIVVQPKPDSVYDRLQNPPQDQFTSTRLWLDWESKHLDTAATNGRGEYVLTLNDLKDKNKKVFWGIGLNLAGSTQRQRDLLAEYAARRDVWNIIQANSPAETEEQIKKLQKELMDYINKQPQESRKICLSPLIFPADRPDQRGVNLIDSSINEYFIRDVLENPAKYDLHPEEEGKQDIYADIYKMLWEAYVLIQYRAVDALLKQFRENADSITSDNAAALNHNLAKLLSALDLAKQTGVSGFEAFLLPDDKEFLNLFASKQYNVFLDKYSGRFVSALRGILNNLYWPARNLEQLLRKTPSDLSSPAAQAEAERYAELAGHQELYQKIKPAVLNLINWYKELNTNWAENIGLRVQMRGIELRETSELDINEVVAELHELQNMADIYGEDEAYAQCKLIEAELCLKSIYTGSDEYGNEKNGYDYYLDMVEDPKMYKYWYIEDSLTNMGPFIKGQYEKGERTETGSDIEPNGVSIPDLPPLLDISD
ncbi:hypothetical protein NO1_0360 [Candidatus Termititenax aidoneus]|uniref:Uncharacterized protein n=1 Tax=Termititenax aidoneus TaxID=2218524 RepID=A0A388T9Y3_TERA1|nr:hypothetical protein NO1_0360 [Candidatus Termititenax aidoneus]